MAIPTYIAGLMMPLNCKGEVARVCRHTWPKLRLAPGGGALSFQVAASLAGRDLEGGTPGKTCTGYEIASAREDVCFIIHLFYSFPINIVLRASQ